MFTDESPSSATAIWGSGSDSTRLSLRTTREIASIARPMSSLYEMPMTRSTRRFSFAE